MKRPEELKSKTVRMPTGHGNLYVTMSEHEGKLFEVFATIGKAGDSIMAKAEVTGRLVSLALRHSIPIEDIIDQLIDISGSKPLADGDTVVKSIPDAVGKVLDRFYGKETER